MVWIISRWPLINRGGSIKCRCMYNIWRLMFMTNNVGDSWDLQENMYVIWCILTWHALAMFCMIYALMIFGQVGYLFVVSICPSFSLYSSSFGSYTNLSIDNASQNVYPKFLNKLLHSGPIPNLTLFKSYARMFLRFPQLGYANDPCPSSFQCPIRHRERLVTRSTLSEGAAEQQKPPGMCYNHSSAQNTPPCM